MQGCCALTGDGVNDALDWLAERLSIKTYGKSKIEKKPKEYKHHIELDDEI
jgi:hypothetical protein